MTISVLFLGTQNAVRSQMAAAFLKKHGGDAYEVYSAGLEEGNVHPLTVKVLQEVGIDTSDLSAILLKNIMGRRKYNYGVIVCRRAEAACPTIADAKDIHRWIFDNPVDGGGTEEEMIARFRATRDKIEARIKLWITETAEEDFHHH